MSLCCPSSSLNHLRQAYVAEHPEEFLQPTGFVYHETRTGSTLVANMLGHVPSNLVTSENSLAEDPVRRCNQCTPRQRARLLGDILPLFGSTQGGHTHSFFKFQDSTTIGVVSVRIKGMAGGRRKGTRGGGATHEYIMPYTLYYHSSHLPLAFRIPQIMPGQSEENAVFFSPEQAAFNPE